MPRYLVSSDSPIAVRAVGRPGQGLPGPGRPVDPDYGLEEVGEPGQGLPGWGGFPERPGHGLPPSLPPRDEWPEIPEDIWDKLPIKPSPEHPMVPISDDPTAGHLPEFPPGVIWPPPRPELPDLSGKSLVLVRVYVSRHVNYLAWQVVDHECDKGSVQGQGGRDQGTAACWRSWRSPPSAAGSEFRGSRGRGFRGARSGNHGGNPRALA